MANYTWSVVSVDCLPDYKKTPDFVQHVYWLCSGADGEYQGSFNGSTQLAPGKPPYTPYAKLTEKMLLDWSFAEMGNFKTEVESKVAAQIEGQKVPQVITPPLPWAKPSETDAAVEVVGVSGEGK